MPYIRTAIQNIVRNHFPEFLYVNTGLSNNVSGGIVREFAVSFYGAPQLKKIRELKTDRIGQLTTLTGTVTRTTEVRPELLYASFTCNECNAVINDVEQQFRYTEVII